MSESLARLLQRHVALGDEWDMVPEGKVMCNWTSCGFVIEADIDNHWRDTFAEHVASVLSGAGYSKPRAIKTAYQLESLPFGSAVQTSDESDTVVLRCEGVNFRNQSGADLSATDLWRYGTHPFTVLYEPAA